MTPEMVEIFEKVTSPRKKWRLRGRGKKSRGEVLRFLQNGGGGRYCAAVMFCLNKKERQVSFSDRMLLVGERLQRRCLFFDWDRSRRRAGWCLGFYFVNVATGRIRKTAVKIFRQDGVWDRKCFASTRVAARIFGCFRFLSFGFEKDANFTKAVKKDSKTSGRSDRKRTRERERERETEERLYESSRAVNKGWRFTARTKFKPRRDVKNLGGKCWFGKVFWRFSRDLVDRSLV